MSRLEKANQIIELLILLQTSYRGLTIDEIAEKFECTRRSAERMKALIVKNFPNKIEEVENQTDRKKRWRLKKGSVNYLINLTPQDFANLEICKDSLTNSTQKNEIQKLIEKLKILDSNKTHNLDIEATLEAQGYAVRQGFKENISSEILGKINEAILCQKQIKFRYYNEEKIVNPYGLLIGEKIYLIARFDNNDKNYTFRLSKIEQIQITNNYFDRDESFNIKEFSQKSFGVFQDDEIEVKLEFKKSAQEVLEYNFHPTQKIKELENGNFEVTFTASGQYEIITELLKWRDCVKIISPEKLKQEYKNTVISMFNNLD